MSDKPYATSTDGELLESLGRRLRALRKARGLTQQQVAERAELARSTVSEAERGENATLQTVIRLLRVYGRLGALEGFIPEPELSPMARLRKRTSRTAARAKPAPGEEARATRAGAAADGDIDEGAGKGTPDG